MNLQERIAAMVALGQKLQEQDEFLEALMHRTFYNNKWFTIANQKKAVEAISQQFLAADKLQQWVTSYDLSTATPKKVGLILAGNIPLVGFHDVLSVFIAGHQSIIKPSSKDAFVLPYLIKLLNQIDERSTPYFKIVEQLKGFDAVIATGSNNSARYFDAYFGRYPNIIRRNRNAIAVLDGEESREELLLLGKDVFDYFGLGCRNVSKLYLPKDYEFEPLLEALHEYRDIVRNEKYKNNFDYNYAMLIINKEPFKSNGCTMLLEQPSLQSRIASLHYEFYDKQETLVPQIEEKQEEIQCVIARQSVGAISTLPFGKAQSPELWDYADGVDTLSFLAEINQD